jgi:tetratricopeptide (TPR) repeat protein
MIAECRKIIGMEPGNLDAYVYLARAYEQKAMYREAMDAWSKYITLAGLSTPDGEAIRASAPQGRDDYWRKRELLERIPSVEVFNLAETLAQLGGNDEAMQLLEKCFAARDSHLMYLKVHPNLDRLRSDPRFAGLMRRMQFAP